MSRRLGQRHSPDGAGACGLLLMIMIMIIGHYSLVVRTLDFLARGPGFESWHRG